MPKLLILETIEIVPEGFALALQGTVEIQRRHGGFSTNAPSETSGLRR